MKLYIIFFLTSMALAMDVRAQLVWNVTHTDQMGSTQFIFYSISCAGNNCTGGLTVIDQTSFEWTAMFHQTTDGGQTWFSQIPDVEFPGNFPNKGFSKIQRIDSLNIVAISEEFIIRTFDAGATWVKQDRPVQYPLMDIHFSDPLIGILVSAGDWNTNNIFLTSDGGMHWTEAPFKGPYLWYCHSYGNDKFRVVRYSTGEVYTTTDKFTTVDSTGPAFDSTIDKNWESRIIAGCTFGVGDTLLAFGTSARPGPTFDTLPGYNMLVRTTNGGKQWNQPVTFFSGQYGGIWHTTTIERDTVLAVGESRNKIFRSFDRGATWEIDSLLLDTVYNAIHSQGIAMTGDGHLLGSFTYSPFRPGPSIFTRGKWVNSSVYELVAYKTRIYPNPATTKITVVSPLVSRPIYIYDIMGREVLRSSLSEKGTANFDLTYIPNGLYTLSLEFQGKKVLVGKVIIIKE